MKLHRHTSDESDDMTTHKWPQFVPEDVKHCATVQLCNITDYDMSNETIKECLSH